MKLSKLIEHLQYMQKNCSHSNHDPEVVIQVRRGYAAMGPCHTVEVNGGSGGIDWDSGKFFINTSEELSVMDDRTKEALKFLNRCVDSYHIQTFREKNDRNLARTLKGHLKETLEKIGYFKSLKEFTDNATPTSRTL